jgi:hypothetical protein
MRDGWRWTWRSSWGSSCGIDSATEAHAGLVLAHRGTDRLADPAHIPAGTPEGYPLQGPRRRGRDEEGSPGDDRSDGPGIRFPDWYFFRGVDRLGRNSMRRATLAAVALLVSWTGSTQAACYCTCVDGAPRQICQVPDEIPAACPRMQCPPPAALPPPGPVRALPPKGAYSCEYVQVRNGVIYQWRVLCASANRSSTALVPPAPPAIPSPLSKPQGQLCDSDRDCPPGSTCTRRSMNDAWRCSRR